MALTWSGGSRESCAQTTIGYGASSEPRSDAKSFALTPQTLWLLRTASATQLAVLISLWPSTQNSTALSALIATATVLTALTLFIRLDPSSTATTIQPNKPCNDNPAQPRTTTKTKPVQPQAPIRTAPRRNRAPIRAQIAPIAAPNAALARNLEPQAHAWADLMARMSHDLRTPLNAVIGFSDLMQREAFGPLGSPRYQEYARHIQDCGTALLKSAEDTLAMTTALSDNTGNAEAIVGPIDLEALATETWQSQLHMAAPREITFHIDVPVGLEIQGERKVLRQVLMNLMNEAMAHAQNGAQVVLSARGDTNHVEIELSPTACQTGTPVDTLAICVARTLLHLSGASLVVLSDQENGWRALTVLDRTRQSDFFAQNNIAITTGANPAPTIASAA